MILINFVSGCWKNFSLEQTNSNAGTRLPASMAHPVGGKMKYVFYVLNRDAINAAMDCLQHALEQYQGRVTAGNKAEKTAAH